MRLRLPRRSRGEPDPENGAEQTREDGQSDEGPPEPEASEFAVGADPRDYEGEDRGEDGEHDGGVRQVTAGPRDDGGKHQQQEQGTGELARQDARA